MQTINVGNKRLIAVTVPEDAKVDNFEHVYAELFYWRENEKLKHICEIGYDSQIIGLAKSMTEEQWTGIVEREFDTFRDYEMVEQIGSHVFDTATESGLSLLQKHGVDPENTLIIEII